MTTPSVAVDRKLLDATITHQISLTKYSNDQARRIMAVLNRADAQLFAQLSDALERLPASQGTVDYLESMLTSVRALNAQAYQQVQTALNNGAQSLATSETAFTHRLYQGFITNQLAQVTAEQAWTAAYARPFQGTLLREVGAQLGAIRMKRIRDGVRMGYVQGRTTQQIVRDIRGTQTQGFADGFLEVDRRHLETMVRTALSHTAAATRNKFFEANKDVIDKQVWLSTLDNKTTPICITRSGLRYTVGDNPKPVGHSVPWCVPGGGCGPGNAHYSCRSVSLALLPGQDKLYGTRASMNGQVDANMSYGDWLKGQPASVQDEVLGPKRAKLFRDGGLTIDQFSNDKGKWLDLPALEAANQKAFERAGL